MCKFVEITLPRPADQKAIRMQLRKYGRTLEAIPPVPDDGWLPTGHDCFNTCARHCDCGTHLGHLTKEEAEKRRLADQANSLQRKGWSAAKVERWLRDKSRAKRNFGRSHHGAESDLTAEGWSALVKDLLRTESCETLGFTLRWWDEAVSCPAEKVPLDAVNAEFMGRIRTNQLYLFTRY
jgi:hypothetical protein